MIGLGTHTPLLDPRQAPTRLEQNRSVLYFCSRGCGDQYQQEHGEDAGAAHAFASTPVGYSAAEEGGADGD